MATVTSMRNRKTPGIYVTELPAFPPSVIGVATAVPGFIGYTQFAQDPASLQPLYNKPVLITSVAEYESYFGKGFRPIFNITPGTPGDYDFIDMGDGTPSSQQTLYNLEQTKDSTFYLYNAIRLFYSNGGGACYIVSVANYEGSFDNKMSMIDASGTSVNLDALKGGLSWMGNQVGPTMLVIPEAVLLPSITDYQALYTEMLRQCNLLQDRVAIMDIYGANNSKNWNATATTTLVDDFYTALGGASDLFNYGMVYYPFLNTAIVGPNEVDYNNFDVQDPTQFAILAEILDNNAALTYGVGTPSYNSVIAKINEMPTTPAPQAAVTQLNQYLTNALPQLQQIENLVVRKIDVSPPSGIMAGIYTQNDSLRGVWNAPANIGLTSVVSPTVNLTDEQQGPLNVPLNGMAVNVIRYFVGRGNIVWGARTLDGNSNDYRFIQIRRTLIYVEQSIKTALQPFVFAANDGQTWSTVTAMVSNFLQGLWSQGGLMGDKASDAFTVQCGLGSTMTGLDVLNGYMIVSITLQMVHPAEFIELTFTQTMQGVA